jgi:hypothetical protein
MTYGDKAAAIKASLHNWQSLISFMVNPNPDYGIYQYQK